MFVTVDAVAVAVGQGAGLDVMLVERGHPPYKGSWALPGGFVELDEDLPDACARELREETCLQPTAFVQVGAWGKPGRDPRGRDVTVAYLAPVRPSGREAAAGDDAAKAAWHSVDRLPRLAFDHGEIIASALDLLRQLAGRTHVLFALLPETFTMAELREAVLAVTGQDAGPRGVVDVLARAQVEAASGARYRCVAESVLTPLG
jgi:8-oxo-dGTP diphosphatase